MRSSGSDKELFAESHLRRTEDLKCRYGADSSVGVHHDWRRDEHGPSQASPCGLRRLLAHRSRSIVTLKLRPAVDREAALGWVTEILALVTKILLGRQHAYFCDVCYYVI